MGQKKNNWQKNVVIFTPETGRNSQYLESEKVQKNAVFSFFPLSKIKTQLKNSVSQKTENVFW